ncbi:MAG: hypothetical protein E6K03_09870 [Methanobacteriota archaeon]|nr:MAG: hypothetical protein E6K03_09870 [Euryarchaeota archaeon]
MSTSLDRDQRALRLAGVVLSALLVSVVAANVLWPGPVSPTAAAPRMPPTQSPFPTFPLGSMLHAAKMDANANLSMRLLMTSLQGLVNRASVELYLDVPGVAGNTSQMLSYLVSRYNVTYDIMSAQAAMDAYVRVAAGLIVYDPSRPESIDIGTVMAAQQHAVLVGPDLAGSLAARYGLPVLFDYARRADWTALDPIGAYDRALRELYPSSYPYLLAILPPDRWAIRDYLVQTGTFVFYFTQGILASPFETAATMRVLQAAPRGIPILGWFNSPTLTEENSFIQMASAAGKFVVGVQDVPNLSVLTALGRNEMHRQVSSTTPTPVLEDKTYLVLAVPDGDNLDFVAGRMWDLWSEPVRGNVSFAWSLNPLLVDLAPPLLDMYYDSATSLDRFIAAPSGAGYLYPDYTGPGDLPPFVNFTKRYLDAADMDVVWLLNAFAASEIPYSSRSLSTYVDGLRPGGIVLDYDDQPRTRDAWMQAGTQAIGPVIRSTHFWTTSDNVLGKLDTSTASRGAPNFLWLTVYTFRFDLRDARALVGELSRRMGGDLQIVTPTQFFGLLRADFVRTAHTRLAATDGDPVSSLLFPGLMESARAHLRDADASIAGGDANRGAYAAYLGLEDLRSVSSAEALLTSLLVVLTAAVLAYIAHRSSRRPPLPSERLRLGVLLMVTAAVALLVFALREALDQNFWTYPTILLGVVAAGIHRPLRRWLDRAYPGRAPTAAALVALVFTTLAIRTSAAFPLAVIGILLAIDAYLARRPGSSSEVLLGLAFGTAIGFSGGFDLPTFAVLSILLVVPTLGVRGTAIIELPGRHPAALIPGFLLALPLSVLSVAFSYSLALRLDFQGGALLTTAGALLVLAPTLALLSRRIHPRIAPIISEIAGLALAVVFSGLVLLSRGAIPTVFGLLGLFASLSYAALAELDRFAERGGSTRRALTTAILFLPLIVLFFRMPPIVFSLVIFRLPEAVEYALYAPTVMIAGAALFLAVATGLRTRFREAVGKDYDREVHGGPEGP